MFNNYDIVEMPLSLKRNRTMVEDFLAKSELRLDDMDYYAAVVDRDNFEMLAGGGFKDDIIKCIAVDDSLRGTGMSQQLISHLMSQMNAQGFNSVKVFTKPSNIDIFESLGFKTLGESSKAILLENGLDGLSTYVNYLKSLKRDGKKGFPSNFPVAHKAFKSRLASASLQPRDGIDDPVSASHLRPVGILACINLLDLLDIQVVHRIHTVDKKHKGFQPNRNIHQLYALFFGILSLFS